MYYLVPYSLFFTFLIPLFILNKTNYRLVYLHGVSTCLLLLDTPMRPFILISMLHSAIHHIWPFINKSGYNIKETPFFDVLCHLIMMVWSYNILDEKIENPIFHYLTLFWCLGSFFNTIISALPVSNINDWNYILFAWTSITQAISTGYWIATMLWYPCMIEHEYFLYHWLIWIGMGCINWIVYKTNNTIIGKSMEHSYVEAVFIVCTWVPFITSYKMMNTNSC